MKYRPLGSTGLNVSVIGLGTHQFSGEWGRNFEVSEVDAVLQRARELGINLVDTAECYGDHTVEALLGKTISRNRGDWILATKFGHTYPAPDRKAESWSPDGVRRQLERSLEALGTDYIDLYQFHSGGNEVFFNDALWAMLQGMVRAGKIRFLGVSLAASLLHAGDLRQLHAAGTVGARAIQSLYNRLQPEAEKDVLPYCQTHNLGVLARVPLAKGFLAGHYRPGTTFAPSDTRSRYSSEFNDEQLRLVDQIRQQEVPPGQNMAQWALAWCLRHAAVSAVIVGCKSLEQLELNAGAA